MRVTPARLARLTFNSISLGAGQFCTNPGLIFLVKSEKSEQFIEKLSHSLQNVEEQAMLHPTIFANYQKNKNKIISNKEVSVLVDGQSSKINHIKPVLCKISSKNFLQNEDLQEEVFGSFTLVVEAENEKEFFMRTSSGLNINKETICVTFDHTEQVRKKDSEIARLLAENEKLRSENEKLKNALESSATEKTGAEEQQSPSSASHKRKQGGSPDRESLAESKKTLRTGD